jgi:D-alanine--poly(phosphoribitol) ligase subunit 1
MLLDRFPDAKVWNTYGPTEATVAMTSVEITRDVLAKNPRLPIGVVQPEDEVFIVNDEGVELAPGEKGELLISGKSVAKGYYKNTEKTMEAFKERNGTRVYHTKDLCSMDENGNIFYHGRIDFQVKVNGFRIELQDIEVNLLESEFVNQAIVLPEMDGYKVKRLVAVIVPNENDFEKEYELTKAIFNDLRARVMDYMVPNRAVYLESFPLNQNGKVDRKKIEAEVFKK